MTVGLVGLLGLVFLVALGATRLLCSPASGLALLDYPNERSLHAAPLPRTGGLAIFGSVLLGIVVCVALDEGAVFQADAIIWILGMASLVGAVSFWDDRAGLSPWFRLGAQALAAGGVTWGAGLTVTAVPAPFVGSLALSWLAVPVTVLFLMWMANLYNFMDGMDGFAGGMTVLGFGFLGVLAWQDDHYLMGLAILTGTAAGGFLWYNLPPARIFMGDVGSVPLGFIAAALAVLGARDGLFDIWVPLLIFSPFIVDATVTLFRRLFRGEKVWRAHREHYYQRLVLAGWGHRKTVLAEYGLMLACGISAVLYCRVGEAQRLIILAGWVITYALLAWAVRWMERPGRSLQVEG
jgi:UDP-N-acetylmuramyl pentapeptide phosphotransferase/UDP-N-acetylglucosamine-1-phosphate transferase